MALAKKVDWERITVTKLDGGLNVELRPEDIANSESPDLLNCDYVEGFIKTDTGYITFGQPILGIPQGAFQIFLTTGASALILITTQSLYTWNTTFLEWDIASDVHHTLTTSDAIAGATHVDVADVTGWSVNDWIGIFLDDGSQLITKVTNIATLTLTFSPAIPLGKIATTGNLVYHAPKLTGSLDYLPQFETLPANDWCIITNGVDPLFYYMGGIVQDVPGLPFTTSCRALNVFHEMLFLGDITEGGTRYPQRVRRSDAGDPTNWSTGVSGIDNLLDTEDFILTISNLGPWLIIYREESIMRGSYIGLLNQTMFYEYMIEGEGALSAGSVCEIGSEHFFTGTGGMYLYDGGYSLESVGNKIFYRTLAITGDLNPTFHHRTFSFYVIELDEVWIFYCSGSNSTPDTMLRIVLENSAWFVRKFANRMAGFGFYINELTRIWSQLQGSWLAQNYAWSSKVQLANSPVTLLCDAINSQVYNYDYLAEDDNGNVIPFSYSTKDFGLKNYLLRVNGIIVQGRGDNIKVDISLDQGNTYQNYGTMNFGARFNRQRLYKQFVSEFVRFRFSSTDPGAALSWYEIEYGQEGEW